MNFLAHSFFVGPCFNSRQKNLPHSRTAPRKSPHAPWASPPTLWPRRRRHHRRTTMIPPTTSTIRSCRQYSWRTHFPTRFIPLLSSPTTTINVPYFSAQSTMSRYCITPLTFCRGMVSRNYSYLLQWGRRHWRNISVVTLRVVVVVVAVVE